MLDAALASAAAEPDPQRRLAAAVACALEAPVLLRPVLDLIGHATEAELRTLALGELLRRLPDDEAAEATSRLEGLLPEEFTVRVLVDLASDAFGSADRRSSPG